MHIRHWQYTVLSLCLLSGLNKLAVAQEAAPVVSHAAVSASHSHRGRPAGRGGFGFAASLNRSLNLTPEQLDSVRGLLAQQHQETASLREQTDDKIRALLNGDQRKKFDAMLADQKEQRGRRSERS